MGFRNRTDLANSLQPTVRTLADIEHGIRKASPGTYAMLENKLSWAPGSIDTILDGGEPNKLVVKLRRPTPDRLAHAATDALSRASTQELGLAAARGQAPRFHNVLVQRRTSWHGADPRQRREARALPPQSHPARKDPRRSPLRHAELQRQPALFDQRRAVERQTLLLGRAWAVWARPPRAHSRRTQPRRDRLRRPTVRASAAPRRGGRLRPRAAQLPIQPGVTRKPVWMDVTAQLTAPPAAATTPRWPGQAGWVTITRSPASKIAHSAR